MGRFLLGVACSLAASGAAYWFLVRAPAREEPCAGMCGRGTTCEGTRCVASASTSEGAEAVEPRATSRRRRSGARPRSGGAPGTDEAIDDRGISDDLDLGPQEIDMDHGGEGQLANSTIEAVMGKNFGGIRRCIFMAQAEREDHVRGRMTIGMRIRPSGEVAAVTVHPPAPLATGELPACVRSVVARVRFPSFDGREMAVSYPVTLD